METSSYITAVVTLVIICFIVFVPIYSYLQIALDDDGDDFTHCKDCACEVCAPEYFPGIEQATGQISQQEVFKRVRGLR